MRINIGEFKKFLQKATINYSFETVQIAFTGNRAKSKMTNPNSDAISILDLQNTLIPSLRGEHEFNFQDPNQNLVPFLSLIDDEQETDITIHQEKIVLVTGNLKSNIFFCSPQVVSTFDREGARAGTTYFTEFQLDDDFIENFSMIKKIGQRFGKVYFSVEGNKLVIETTDKTNRYCNGLKFELYDIRESDLSMSFDYRSIVNVMASIGDDYDQFKAHLTYRRDADLGMVFFKKENDEEKYFLMSKQEVR